MGTPITVKLDQVTFEAELNDSASARALLAHLPLELAMARWGDEYYGDGGLQVERAHDAREAMHVGELAIWPQGHALCIFFGPTPASRSNEPRAIAPVNPVGRLLGDCSALRGLGDTVTARVTRRQPPA